MPKKCPKSMFSFVLNQLTGTLNATGKRLRVKEYGLKSTG